MAKKHYRFAPSAAERWLKCPGSVALCETVPESASSSHADEGTVAHAVAEAVLSSRMRLEAFEGMVGHVDAEGEVTFELDFLATGGYPVTQEMLDAVSLFVDTVRLDFIPGEKIYTEHRVHITESCSGTADCVMHKKGKRLRVVDLKYGKGVSVEVENNPQLMLYLLGAANAFGWEDDLSIMVIQPRRDHADGVVREWRVPHATLKRFESEVLFWIEYIQMGATEDKDFRPGDHCRWCPAKLICKAVQNQVVEMARLDFDVANAQPAEPATISTDQLSRIVHFSSAIRSWLSACEDALIERVKSEPVPGWKLVPSLKNRKWADKEKAVAVLKSLGFQKKELFTEELRSPKQIEDAARKWKNKADVKAAVNELTVREEGAPTLAPSDDPRPAVGSALTDFTAVDDEPWL